MSQLRAAQEAMRAALHDEQTDALAALIAGHDFRKIEVYRFMYWARLLEALADDFPRVRGALGEARFEEVAREHVRRHPSRDPSLAWIGRGLDETLMHLGLDAESALARLECARVEAFWSPDAPVASAAVLGALGEQLGAATLTFHPSVRLVEQVVVWRRGYAVVESTVARIEARALRAALDGATVATVCEAFLDAESPEEAAVAAIVRWVTDGWVAEARVAD